MRIWNLQSKESKIKVKLPWAFSDGVEFSMYLGEEIYQLCWERGLNSLFVRKCDSQLEKVFAVQEVRILPSDQPSSFDVELMLLGEENSVCFTAELDAQDLIYRKKNLTQKGQILRSPITGSILKIFKKQGDPVEKGEILMIIEAMKMENNVLAPSKGILGKFIDPQTNSIKAGDHIATITAD